jgi:hypothetical protein
MVNIADIRGPSPRDRRPAGGAAVAARRRVRRLVLCSVLAMAGCFDSGDDCTTQVDRLVTMRTPTDPAMDFRLEACRTYYPVACEDVCDLLLRREDQFTQQTLSHCEVAFFGDTVAVKMSFETFSGGNNCPIEGDGPVFVGGGVK